MHFHLTVAWVWTGKRLCYRGKKKTSNGGGLYAREATEESRKKRDSNVETQGENKGDCHNTL